MKKYIVILLVVLMSGCSLIREKEMVAVDKPFPACPKPPVVPEYDLWVDKLSDADLTDPGKVGQAYKHDMIYLRQRLVMDNQILLQYEKTSQQYDEAKKQIDTAFENLNK